MTTSVPPNDSLKFAAIWRRVKWGGLILLLAFTGITAFRGIISAWRTDQFPDALLVKAELLPSIFPIHMVAGGLALILVPAAMALRGTRWHKWAGRLAVADVCVAGVTAIRVALTAPVHPLAGAGFAVQGLLWLGLIARGVWHIRRRDVASHQRMMLLMAAVTSGAMFFRIYLALWAIFGSSAGFKLFYALDSWLAWGLPLAAMWWLTLPRPGRHPAV